MQWEMKSILHVLEMITYQSEVVTLFFYLLEVCGKTKTFVPSSDSSSWNLFKYFCSLPAKEKKKSHPLSWKRYSSHPEFKASFSRFTLFFLFL